MYDHVEKNTSQFSVIPVIGSSSRKLPDLSPPRALHLLKMAEEERETLLSASASAASVHFSASNSREAVRRKTTGQRKPDGREQKNGLVVCLYCQVHVQVTRVYLHGG